MKNLRRTAERLAVKRRQDEGFTLIELLVVIVILGILAAVVVFAVGGITDRGQDSACAAERKTLEVAVEAYRAQEDTYPVDADALLDVDGDPATADNLIREAPDNHTVAGSVITAIGECV